MKNFAQLLSKIAYIIAGAILLFLALKSVTCSYHFDLYNLSSALFTVKDRFYITLPLSITLMGLFFALSKLLFKNLDETVKRKRLNLISIIVSSLIFVILLIWVICTLIPPYWDQMQVYLDAQNFNNGDYSDMELAYLSMYPQQYGLIFFESLLLKIYNHYGFLQAINALFIALTVFVGTKLTVEISSSYEAGFFGLCFLSTCFPLFYYVSFVYGDVFFIFSAVLVSFLTIKFIKTGKWGYIIGGLITSLIMIPVRENSLIFLISLSILLILYSMKNKSLRLFVLALLYILLPLLSNKAIEGYYENKCDIDINEKEMPAINWIVMGLQGDPYTGSVVGYYNGFNLGTWSLYSGDKEIINEVSKEFFNDRISEFKSNPRFAADFFIVKASEQWLDPFFESTQMTFNSDVDYNSIKLLYNSKTMGIVRFYMNLFQTSVYLLAFAYIVYCVRRKKEFYSLVLAVGFIGGFLFSLIWEAKGRYTFPFFIMLIPIAACGLANIINAIKRKD
ncbi:MAG: hypothetical protein MJ107_02425 [Lachnospiraceae bacterium]|nr:hypothetical protein [Lachnospiraceae bacterium]